MKKLGYTCCNITLSLPAGATKPQNYELDRKMVDPFRMGTTSSITMQSLGKDVQRAPAVGVKIWCLSLFFVCHAPRPERCSLEGDIVRTSIV